MSKVKKVLAMILALAMVLGTALTTFAAPDSGSGIPQESDRKEITISNVESGMTVTAYQIVKADYNDYGFIGYIPANKNINLTDVTKPTSEEVTELAKTIETLGLQTADVEEKNGVYSADLNPGYWIILVTGSGTKVYNPMLAGVYYSKDGSTNEMVADPINANDKWSLETTDAFAKSSEVPVKKEIVTPGSGNNKGDDTAYGETVTFKITTKIPSYSAEYTHATFIIHDELSEGLSFTEGLEAALQAKLDKDFGNGSAKATISDQKLDIEFESDYILANGLKDIEIQYTAFLNEKAGINFDFNTNKVKVEYTNDPSETDDAKKTTNTDEEITYHYTFGIDSFLNGENKELTKELIKTDTGKTEIVDGKEVTIYKPLNGAVFTLTRTDVDDKYTGKKVFTAITGAGGVDGDIQFKGLDAGTYELVETKAPDGYKLDNTKHKVEIDAHYNEDGTLLSYTIKIDGEEGATSTYSNQGKTNITTITKEETQTGIRNTTIGSLPSTGGIGTTIFTIGGCIIMIAAAGLFFASRRKSAKK